MNTEFPEQDAWLELADGTRLAGTSFGAKAPIAGEVVFNTGMVGYPESLTDPSYRGQILVLTYPLVGNYGVPEDSVDEKGISTHFESSEIHVSGLIISSYSFEHSHWNSQRSLGEWLASQGIPALFGIDTRALTIRLREQGATLGRISFGVEAPLAFHDPNDRNLVAEVSSKEVQRFPAPVGAGAENNKVPHIIAVDCGMKNNITRLFLTCGVRLTVVPWDYDFMQEEWDGLFISNGPGNPAMCDITVQNLKRALELSPARPIFGICLGNQLMALATGASTYKMKYGNRGMNQPVIDLRTGHCYITPQNHGFAVDGASLPRDWRELFVNANDLTNEGIIHTHKPFFSAQFHPEATAGPTDTEYLLRHFVDVVRGVPNKVYTMEPPPPLHNIRKVLILGSGGLSIGQAGEFDYSGSQCIKAMKEEQIETVLINPNIATVQTSKNMADKVYFLPVQADFVESVIAKERPDGVLLTFGGQTALNCGIALEKAGVFEKYKVRVLGTPIRTIEITEDRELFALELGKINEKTAASVAVTTVADAVVAAEKIGYPVIVRAAFALGGLGSGFADNAEELIKLTTQSFASVTQILVEKSMKGWKEIEYEVVRDWKDNCITVCNMENFDPLGIHTGDSIVVAPSQTLTNSEYFMLRAAATRIIRHLGVVGECNIQYALNPDSEEYCVIEVNARLSRSSALASKATGYPLAYVAAKLALLKDLPQLRNAVTKVTTACFEPSLDYCVVKIPCWDLKKFCRVSTVIGSAMKSVGEVMAIGRRFEETFQKAVRMVHPSITGLHDGGDMFGRTAENDGGEASSPEQEAVFFKAVREELVNPSDQRVFAVYAALDAGMGIEEVHSLTRIDRWFLQRIDNIVRCAQSLKKMKLPAVPKTVLLESKRRGFSDEAIGHFVGASAIEVRTRRKELQVLPCVKQIDTLAAEFPALTNYLYVTYGGDTHDVDFDEPGYIVLGCGAYRIGSSVEFDWCAVECVTTLRQEGQKAIIINYNPETVSTDFDNSDRLYFEELSLERVLDIVDLESPKGVVVSVGGQIPNNLAVPLAKHNVPIVGTSPANIDRAEDRGKFSALLDSIHVDQPPWQELSSVKDAEDFAERVGYPVLVRPSYVLSGAAMKVAHNDQQLTAYLGAAADVSKDHPVVISKFISGAKEVEFDAVVRNGEILNYAICEHVENAGVHSGDATLVLPAQKLYVETMKRINKASRLIAKELNICGPVNIQFMAKGNDILVIECNLRASRTVPFISKVLNVDFIQLATKAMIGLPVKRVQMNPYDLEYVAIKAPIFSFTRLCGADPVLGVEMASTGEVAAFGEDMYEAYLKAMVASGFVVPKTDKKILLSLGPLSSKLELLPAVEALVALGYAIAATPGTAAFLAEHDIKAEVLYPPSSGKSPDTVTSLKAGEVGLLINIPRSQETVELTDGYAVRRTAVDFGVSLLTNAKSVSLMAKSLTKYPRISETPVKPWADYLKMTNFFDRPTDGTLPY